MKTSLLTLQINLQDVAYLATPGGTVRTSSTGPLKFETQTRREAERWEGELHEKSKEPHERDPEGFAAWFATYVEWRSGDRSRGVPHPKKFATKKR